MSRGGNPENAGRGVAGPESRTTFAERPCATSCGRRAGACGDAADRPQTRAVFERYNIVSPGDLRDAARRLDAFAQDQTQAATGS
jgi:hypothetical protein